GHGCLAGGRGSRRAALETLPPDTGSVPGLFEAAVAQTKLIENGPRLGGRVAMVGEHLAPQRRRLCPIAIVLVALCSQRPRLGQQGRRRRGRHFLEHLASLLPPVQPQQDVAGLDTGGAEYVLP